MSHSTALTRGSAEVVCVTIRWTGRYMIAHIYFLFAEAQAGCCALRTEVSKRMVSATIPVGALFQEEQATFILILK